MYNINDATGDTIALIRLTLAGDIEGGNLLLESMEPMEIARVMMLSIGFAATALRMLARISGVQEDIVLKRITEANEKMRNGDL